MSINSRVKNLESRRPGNLCQIEAIEYIVIDSSGQPTGEVIRREINQSGKVQTDKGL